MASSAAVSHAMLSSRVFVSVEPGHGCAYFNEHRLDLSEHVLHKRMIMITSMGGVPSTSPTHLAVFVELTMRGGWLRCELSQGQVQTVRHITRSKHSSCKPSLGSI
jgi:hypothetical protein